MTGRGIGRVEPSVARIVNPGGTPDIHKDLGETWLLADLRDECSVNGAGLVHRRELSQRVIEQRRVRLAVKHMGVVPAFDARHQVPIHDVQLLLPLFLGGPTPREYPRNRLS